MANYNRSSLVLSVNRASWGEVGPSLRRLSATFAGGSLCVRAEFDGDPSEADRRSTDAIGARAHADFPELKLKVEAVPTAGDALPDVPEGWNVVYRRRE